MINKGRVKGEGTGEGGKGRGLGGIQTEPIADDEENIILSSNGCLV